MWYETCHAMCYLAPIAALNTDACNMFCLQEPVVVSYLYTFNYSLTRTCDEWTFFVVFLLFEDGWTISQCILPITIQSVIFMAISNDTPIGITLRRPQSSFSSVFNVRRLTQLANSPILHTKCQYDFLFAAVVSDQPNSQIKTCAQIKLRPNKTVILFNVHTFYWRSYAHVLCTRTRPFFFFFSLFPLLFVFKFFFFLHTSSTQFLFSLSRCVSVFRAHCAVGVADFIWD